MQSVRSIRARGWPQPCKVSAFLPPKHSCSHLTGNRHAQALQFRAGLGQSVADMNGKSAAISGHDTQTAEREIRAGLPALYPRLWRYALSLTGRRDWAEDLAQQSCLRALEKCANFQVGTHLDRWMFRMLHNLWINELRSRKVRTGEGLVPVEDTPIVDDKPQSESNIFTGQVLSAVNALPEAQRACVILAYVEGYSYQETADILGTPIGTVMSRLSAARSKLAVLKEPAS